MRFPDRKLFTLAAAVDWRRELRRTGRRLVVTNGCFDLLHRGHVEYLNRARAEGDALLVAVNADASIRALKGPERPVIGENDRVYMLAALECVDAVVIFATPTATELLAALCPDVYAKGGDYTPETLVQEEYKLLMRLNVDIRILPVVRGFSTTRIIDRIRNCNGAVP